MKEPYIEWLKKALISSVKACQDENLLQPMWHILMNANKEAK